MCKVNSYFNHSLLGALCLGLIFSCLSCKQAGKPGATGEETDEEIVLKKQTGYIIILGGGKTTEDAEAALYRFGKKSYPFNFSDNYPKIFLSDSIEGLNPGFRICVLGFCKEQATAEKVRDLVNVTSEEVAYVKKVNYYMGYMDCPKISFNQRDYSDYDQVFSGPVKDKVPSVRWSLYGQSNSIEESDCEVVNYMLVVKQGDNELDAEVFDEICYEPAVMEEEYPGENEELEGYEEGEEGYEEGEEMEGYDIQGEYPEEGYYENLGERLTFEIEKFELADRTFILVKSAHSAYDEITYEDKLYGFVNGEIKKVADIFTGAEFAAPHVTYEFIPDYSPDDWKKFAILETVQYEHTSETVFEWNDDTQEYEVSNSGMSQ